MKFLLPLLLLFGCTPAIAGPRILDADIVRGIRSVQNYVKNPEFETNIANVTDGGAGIISWSNASPVDNTGSLVINSLVSGEVVKISTRAQQKKLEGQTCVAEFSYSGNATNYKAYVLNVAVNVSGDFPLSNAGAAAIHKLIPYPCQALNSTVDIAIESTAITAGAIKIDSAFVGESEHSFLPGYTAGSVLFSDGEKIAQDNANFFWDDASNRLGIGTAAPSQALDVVGNFQVSGSAQATGVLRSLSGLELQDPGAGTFYSIIQAPVLAATYTLTLPVDDGTANQVLTTDGSGVLSWTTPTSNSVVDNLFNIYDNVDITKLLTFQVAGVTTGTTRVVSAVDADGYMALIDDAPPYADGDILYVDTATSDQKLKVLPIGAVGERLTVSAGGLPVWAAGGGGASVFNCQDFTASGTYTATNTGYVFVEAVGGGGGGAFGFSVGQGGGGGSGAYKQFRTFAVTAATGYAVTIGAGGIGGAGAGSAGGDGGNTLFDGVIVARGARGAANTGSGFTTRWNGSPEYGGGNGGIGGTSTAGDSSESFAGGGGAAQGGGGGASSYADGGQGAPSAISPFLALPGTLGSGGGGGGIQGGGFGTGADGGAGFMRVCEVY